MTDSYDFMTDVDVVQKTAAKNAAESGNLTLSAVF